MLSPILTVITESLAEQNITAADNSKMKKKSEVRLIDSFFRIRITNKIAVGPTPNATTPYDYDERRRGCVMRSMTSRMQICHLRCNSSRMRETTKITVELLKILRCFRDDDALNWNNDGTL